MLWGFHWYSSVSESISDSLPIIETTYKVKNKSRFVASLLFQNLPPFIHFPQMGIYSGVSVQYRRRAENMLCGVKSHTCQRCLALHSVKMAVNEAALRLWLLSQWSQCPTVIKAPVNLPTQGALETPPRLFLSCREEPRLLPFLLYLWPLPLVFLWVLTAGCLDWIRFLRWCSLIGSI